MILFVFVGLFAGFVPGEVAGDLTSIGTLVAFVMVCAGIWVMRVKNPEAKRPFKTPLVPLVPICGIVICTGMIFSLPGNTLLAAGAWMVIGLIVYFAYSKGHSFLRNKSQS
jgi:APA family basic amino acid/polyamine antiporter